MHGPLISGPSSGGGNVLGGPSLTDVGRIPKVGTATGTLGESSITDNGTNVVVTEPLSVGSAPWSGATFYAHTGVDQNLSLRGHSDFADGVTFDVFNDVVTVNKGLVFRASKFAFNMGYVGFGGTTVSGIPSYTIDAIGDINASGVFRLAGTAGVTGTNGSLITNGGIVTQLGGLTVTPPYLYDGTNYFISQPPLKQVTRPIPANFSWISTQGTKATAVATNSAIIIKTSESAFGMRMYGVTIPVTPYTVVADMMVNLKETSQDWCGLALKGTGTNFITFGPLYSAGYTINVSTWSQTAFVSNLYAPGVGEYSASPFVSLKIADDGTNRTYAYSVNGLTYNQILTEAHTANFVPTSIGIFVNDQTAAVLTSVEVCLLGWTVT